MEISSPGTKNGSVGLLALAAVLALVLFVYPMTLGIPLLDPDEGLHASIAQEMVERGEWIVPSFLGEPFLDKPIFYFWAEALSLRLFGFSEAAVRLPGLLFGLLGGVTTAIVGWRMFGRTIGLVAGLFYATTILPTALAQAAAHDVALIPWVNLAILLFWESDRAATRRAAFGYTMAIGLLLGLTILTKGLVGVAIVGLAYGLYLLITRRLTLASCIRGAGTLLIAGLVASTWYLAVEARNPGYLYYYFVERHLLGYATDSQIHGEEPWWYYLPILLGGGLPWIGYLPITIQDALARWKRAEIESPPAAGRMGRAWQVVWSWWQPIGRDDNHGAMVLLWCWLVGCTLFLSTSHSKLVTYIWPVFPAVAILAALAWVRLIDGTLSEGARRSLARTFWMSCLAGPIVLPVAMLVAQSEFSIRLAWPAWVVTIVAALCSWVPLGCWRAGRFQATVATAMLSIAAQFAVVMTLVLPHVAEATTARELARHLNRQGEFPARLLVVRERIGSLVFYLDPSLRAGLTAERLQKVDAHALPESEPETVLVVPRRALEPVSRHYDLTGVPCEEAGRYRLYRASELPRRALTASVPGQDVHR